MVTARGANLVGVRVRVRAKVRVRGKVAARGADLRHDELPVRRQRRAVYPGGKQPGSLLLVRVGARVRARARAGVRVRVRVRVS